MPEAVAANAGAVLAFDFGTQRIGVAVGESDMRLAHPLQAIAGERSELRFALIARLIEAWQPVRLVVGLPLADSGEAQDTTRRAERFARQLEGRFRLPVSMVDERYTSVDAEGSLQRMGAHGAARRNNVDSAAAQLILQQWFDEQGHAIGR